jgi:hypothetical protein
MDRDFKLMVTAFMLLICLLAHVGFLWTLIATGVTYWAVGKDNTYEN